MTVGELIELLEQYPKDLEVLVDCRNLDDLVAFVQKDYYLNCEEPVLHLDI